MALARALAAEPKVLLLDEPFSALDENLRDAMRILVKDIHTKTGITTIMVTHDQNEALSISDRIAVMSEGRIVQVGTPAQVYTQPASLEIAEYFASGGQLYGEVREGVFTADDINFTVEDMEDGPTVAIVRQGNVSLEEDGLPFTVETLLYRGQKSTLVLKRGGFTLRIDVPVEVDIAEGQELGVRIDWNATIKFPIRGAGLADDGENNA